MEGDAIGNRYTFDMYENEKDTIQIFVIIMTYIDPSSYLVS